MIRYILLALVALVAINAQSQSIQIMRVDVDSSRSGIVTAGYGFEVAIALLDIENVNNVSFKLVYDNADVISFSEYAYGDYDDPDNLFIKPPAEGEGALSVAAYSGTVLEESELDNPNVITLRFTVAKSAQNGREVVFRFENAFATSYNEETGGESVELSGEEFSFKIHGFVDIWPGDANQDGEVNTADQNTIGLYLGQGSLSPNMRAFRRPSPSTRFYPQPVLLWDTPEITFADCDGDGDVTVEDGMVVFLNEGKIVGQSDAGIVRNDIFESFIKYSDSYSNTIEQKHQGQVKNLVSTLPIKIYTDKEWESVVIKLENPSGNRLEEVINGEILGEGFSYLAWQDDNSIEVLVGEFGAIQPYSQSGLLTELQFSGVLLPEITSIIGMDSNGAKFPISYITSSVEEQSSELSMHDVMTSYPNSNSVVFDELGRVLFSGIAYDVNQWLTTKTGMYFISINNNLFKIIR